MRRLVLMRVAMMMVMCMALFVGVVSDTAAAILTHLAVRCYFFVNNVGDKQCCCYSDNINCVQITQSMKVFSVPSMS